MREKKKPRVQQRSPENTTVAFSCSKKFLAQIDEAARQRRRTRSNWIVFNLERAIAAQRVFYGQQPGQQPCQASGCGQRLGGWTEDATAALYDHADRIPEIRAALESAK